MVHDNDAVYWLILATCISSVTTAILYFFQHSCGVCWSNAASLCFQRFATSLDIRQETFNQVTNLLIFPRIFQQLGLETFKVVWNHDANAQTRDCVQWGWFCLPTKSYFLYFLAVCGFTHYVWIPRDLNSVDIVGPAKGISALIDISNAAATTRLTDEQLETLRCAFGMGNFWTRADRICTSLERRILLRARCILRCALSVSSLCTMYVMKDNLVPMMLLLLLLGAVVAVVHALRLYAPTVSTVWFRLPWRRRHEHDTDGIEVGLITAQHEQTWPQEDTSEDRGQTGGNVEVMCLTPTEENLPQTRQAVDEFSNTVYSILTARHYYYEVVKQTSVTAIIEELLVSFEQETQIYAIQSRPNFVHYLAERTDIPRGAALHICVHNPIIHPYLTEIYQNFQKGVDRASVCLIVLPPLRQFSACLDSPVQSRLRTLKCTQFVATLCDFEALLLQMTAGFMPKLAFIFPIDHDTRDQHTLTPFQPWLSAERVLGSQNCHWNPVSGA